MLLLCVPDTTLYELLSPSQNWKLEACLSFIYWSSFTPVSAGICINKVQQPEVAQTEVHKLNTQFYCLGRSTPLQILDLIQFSTIEHGAVDNMNAQAESRFVPLLSDSFKIHLKGVGRGWGQDSVQNSQVLLRHTGFCVKNTTVWYHCMLQHSYWGHISKRAWEPQTTVGLHPSNQITCSLLPPCVQPQKNKLWFVSCSETTKGVTIKNFYCKNSVPTHTQREAQSTNWF